MIVLFIIISIFFYIIDVVTMKGHYMECKNRLTTHYVLFLHHIVNVFAQFGWLSNNKYILYTYLLTPIIVMLHWKTNNNECIITEYVNDQCNIKKSTYFRDLWYLLGIKKLKNYDTIHKIYLCVVWVIAFIKIYYSLTTSPNSSSLLSVSRLSTGIYVNQ
jgi:uncharacterized protein (UPF0333 family)